ncbi:MAG: FAD-binding oxidoreductase [bacterium]|nr:FAD-binding oxidoreductase [bacterium]
MSHTVIIGGGIIGGSILYHLYKNGYTGKTTVIERKSQLSQESTSLSAGGFRNIWSTKVNLKLTNYSIEAFKMFKEELGENIGFEQIGYLFTYYEEGFEAIKKFKPELDKNNVRTELLKPEEIKRYVPGFIPTIDHIDKEENEILKMREIAGGLFGPDCGMFNPTSASNRYFEYSKEKNPQKIEIKLNAEVKKILFSGNKTIGVELTDNTIIEGDTVILAAGAFSGDLLKKSVNNEEYWIPIVPWKRMLFTVKMPHIENFEKIPMTIIDNGVYFHPEKSNLLVGRADPLQPFGYDYKPEPAYYEEQMNYYMAARIPGMDHCRIISNQSMWGGLYEHNTQDKNGIIGFHSDLENLFIATGFSGHGVMEAPAIGLSASEMILDKTYKTIPEVNDLAFERFRKNQLIKETIVI